MRHSSTLERLFRNHHRALTSRAKRLIGAHEAEDIVQEAYLKMLEKGDWENVTNVRSYLSKTASNIAIDWLRRERARSKSIANDVAFTQLASGEASVAVASIESDPMFHLRMILGHLPPDCLRIFLLSRVLGHSHAEVAKETGLSVRTVYRCINRALELLDVDPSKAEGLAAQRSGEASRPSIGAHKKKLIQQSPICPVPIVLPNGPPNSEPRPIKIGQIHTRRNAMKIRIAKRVELNVIGRASARCASTCAMTNG
ncbi:methanobactin precursor domain-containing sigma factor [Methylocystis sp. JR02]|uniref:methanobactin precursor domain-containing sigma factor n=1 Tax=Methylocystis sp. JR02 TaxID=3046284 RepID=UPI0024BA8576|nr:methanobactin precursor domain-containing sigma factor [Methylocystis sp. JR02]MDJ0450684.1 methanobactin precursor domain-containing sigma factor [Methylocystis sp. JR02]